MMLIRICVAAVLMASAQYPAVAQMTTPVNVSVSDTGAAFARIPIVTPPGIAGVEPNLELVYSSQSGSFIAGVGWTLGGLPSITRCPRTVYQDGITGAVTFTLTDRYCLDGKRLMAKSGSDGGDGTEYRLEQEVFSQIFSRGTAGASPFGGPAYFTVKTRDGLTMEFGATNDSRIEAPGLSAVRAWALNKVSDTKGNYFTVSYTKDAGTNFLPTRIDYTGNSATGSGPMNTVFFDYESRPDPLRGAEGGRWVTNPQRLKTIRTSTAGVSGSVLSYSLSYGDVSKTSGRSRLSEVVQCSGAGQCLPPVKLTWDQNPAAQVPFGFALQQAPVSLSRNAKWITADVDGDGLADLVGVGVGVQRNNGNGTYTFVPWRGPGNPPLGTSGFKDYQTFVVDMNNDGRVDLVTVTGRCLPDQINGCTMVQESVSVFLNSGNLDFNGGNWTWSTNVNAASPLFFMQPADYNGDGYPDLARDIGSGETVAIAMLINTRTGLSDAGRAFTGPAGSRDTVGTRISLIDFNGDGLCDLVVFRNSGALDLYLNTGSGFGPLTSSTPGLGVVGQNRIWFAGDFNSDGRVDIVNIVSGQGTTTMDVFLNNGVGFSPERWVTTTSPKDDPSTYTVVDADGDGRSDVLQFQPSADSKSTNVIGWKSTGAALVASTWLNSTYWGVPWLTSDVDGRGGIGLIKVTSASDVDDTAHIFHPVIATFDRLISIGSLYDRYNIEYQTLPQAFNTSYFKEVPSAFPTMTATPAMPVVTSIARRNVSTISWSYGSLRSRTSGRRFMAFNWVQQRNASTGLVSRKYFREDFPFTGLVDKEGQGVDAANWSSLRLTQNNYRCMDFVSASECTVTPGRRYYTYLSQSDERNADLNGAALPRVLTQRTVDAYGNVLTVSAERQDAGGTPSGYSNSKSNTYFNDEVSWRIGLLLKSVTTSRSPESNPSPTPATLVLRNCATLSPTLAPNAATLTCSLGNSGQAAATSISYAVPSGLAVSGPTSCTANTNDCGTVTVRTPRDAGSFTGSLTATPTPAGASATVSLSLTVGRPEVLIQPVSTNWGVVGAASDSGDWPTIRNTSASSVLITAHATLSGPSGMWAWQGGGEGYCTPGNTVLAPGGTCRTFFGIGGAATPGNYTAAQRISYSVVGGGGAVYTVDQSYAFGIATTVPSDGMRVFGDVLVSTTSPQQTVTLANQAMNGGSLKNLSITGVGNQPANFPFTHDCGSTLAANAACTVRIAFNPTWIGNGFSAGIQVRGGYSRMEGGADTGYTPQNIVDFTIPLSGNGMGAILSLSCGSSTPVTYPAAATLSCTLSNSGNLAASSIAYAAPAGLLVGGPTSCSPSTSNCGTVTLTTASGSGTYAGNVTASPAPGTGTAASAPVSLVVNASPPNLVVSNCSSLTPVVTPNSATMDCTLGNTGQTSASGLTYFSPQGTSISGPTTCAASTANCGVIHVMTDTSAGVYSGSLQVFHAASQTQVTASVELVVQPSNPSLSIAPASWAFGSVKEVTVSKTLTISNTGGAGPLSITSSNSRFSIVRATCPANGATMGANSTCTVDVKFTGDPRCGGGVPTSTTVITASSGGSSATASGSAADWVYKITDPFCR